MPSTVANTSHTLSVASHDDPKRQKLFPILYMMKLKHREFNDLPKGTSLVNGKLGFEHGQ